MRLWSTGGTHDATRPRRQSARYGSVLTATLGAPIDVPFEVEVEGRALLVGPAAPDRRHVARDRLDAILAVDEQRVQSRGLHEQPVRRDVRAVVALALRAVALRAYAHPLVAAEVGGRLSGHPRLVVGDR